MDSCLIVLDGIDGSGKSTQARLLKEFFEECGEKSASVHEPGTDTEIGREIKRLVKSEEARKMNKEDWVGMFTKERKETLLKTIIPALKKGKIVIADRYYYSTLAYQLDEDEWKSYAGLFKKPDLAIILDIPIPEAMKRIARKNREQGIRRAIFEESKRLEKTRAKFLKMKKFKEVRIIDGKMDVESVFWNILKEVARL